MEEKEFDLVRIQLGKYLEPVQLEEILTDVKKKADMTSAKVMGIAQECKDPSTLMIISIIVSVLGVDRFMIKEIGMGVLKLLTGGLCGILWLIDIFTIQKKTKEYNYTLLKQKLTFM